MSTFRDLFGSPTDVPRQEFAAYGIPFGVWGTVTIFFLLWGSFWSAHGRTSFLFLIGERPGVTWFNAITRLISFVLTEYIAIQAIARTHGHLRLLAILTAVGLVLKHGSALLQSFQGYVVRHRRPEQYPILPGQTAISDSFGKPKPQEPWQPHPMLRDDPPMSPGSPPPTGSSEKPLMDRSAEMGLGAYDTTEAKAVKWQVLMDLAAKWLVDTANIFFWSYGLCYVWLLRVTDSRTSVARTNYIKSIGRIGVIIGLVFHCLVFLWWVWLLLKCRFTIARYAKPGRLIKHVGFALRALATLSAMFSYSLGLIGLGIATANVLGDEGPTEGKAIYTLAAGIFALGVLPDFDVVFDFFHALRK